MVIVQVQEEKPIRHLMFAQFYTMVKRKRAHIRQNVQAITLSLALPDIYHRAVQLVAQLNINAPNLVVARGVRDIH